MGKSNLNGIVQPPLMTEATGKVGESPALLAVDELLRDLKPINIHWPTYVLSYEMLSGDIASGNQTFIETWQWKNTHL